MPLRYGSLFGYVQLQEVQKLNTHSEQVRRMERQYRRKKRTSKLEDLHKNLPFWICALLLTATAVWLVWCTMKPQTAPVSAGGLRVYFLDVGQGDSALLCTDSHSILIDGGESEYGTAVVQMIRAAGVERLDCVINSHPHSDHIGGLTAVLEQIPVGAVYLPDMPESKLPTAWSFTNVLEIAAEKEIPVRTPACHETISLGAAELEFICTDNAGFEDMNDCSLVCSVICGSRRFLFTGDLSTAGELAMLAEGNVLSADVWKVGHHGSSQSATPDFLAAVSPKYAVISCGALNDYGHPAQRTMLALIDAGCSVYRTDIDHSVVFETDGQDISVIPDYDFGF